ncbi:MAG: LytR C-terminal domain-containing protein [Roseburia sp.]|nr:LytR C-terminal domain-containing protein [Roseburia sp.]
MQGKGVAKIIFRTFLKTMGIIILLLAVGVASYFLTMLFYKTTEREERSTQYEHVIDVSVGSESSNLIYSVEEDTRLVKAVVLELFDKETGNLDYVTIPNKTQISLSNEKYQEYMEVSSQIPQIPTLRDINEYFTGDVAYEYGILLLQEELNVEIGYFTALDSEEFNKRFEKKEGAFTPREEYLDTISQYKDEAAMKDFIEKEWDVLISDITLSQKQQYASGLIKVDRDYIYAHRAYAEEIKGKATLDGAKTKKMIDGIWESGERKEKQKSVDGTAAPTNLDKLKSRGIWITNGSRINGLAASFKEKFEEKGLYVMGVGDFSGEIQKKTVIYTRKKRWGRYLKPFFKNPVVKEVQAQDLTNGADIEIVLGTDDKQTGDGKE